MRSPGRVALVTAPVYHVSCLLRDFVPAFTKTYSWG